MSTTITVPDIGNFSQVEVIEIHVKVGDQVVAEQALITLESDKASIEIPAIASGTVAHIHVQLGDKISKGDQVVTLTTAAVEHTAQAHVVQPHAAPVSVAPATPVANDEAVDLVVLGAGPGGYSAAFRAADLGLKVVLIERYATLGGVCLNVGCIPSKALLHVTKATEEAKHLADQGVLFAQPEIDLGKLRSYKESVVNKLTMGLAGMAKARKVKVVQGTAQFASSHSLRVTSPEGEEQIVHFKQAIIAAGSRPIVLPFLPTDPRIMDSTGALALKEVPKRLLVIGGGIIGMEMATVYATLGSQISVVEFADRLIPGADADLSKVYEKYNKSRFAALMLKTKVVSASATDAGIVVSFEGEQAPLEPQTYDAVLVAVGRAPNGLLLAADLAGVTVDDRGFIAVDQQMRTNQAHIFAIGDIVGQPMLAHKAVHEGHVAAEVAAGHKRYFDVRQIPSVAYADPELAWTGLTESEAKAQGIAVEKAVFPWAASGKAIAHNRTEGFTKLLFDKETHQILGGGIVGYSAGDLIGEVALAIEMGADATDIAHTIHPHPTLIESLGMAAEVFEGTCTDLPPARKR